MDSYQMHLEVIHWDGGSNGIWIKRCGPTHRRPVGARHAREPWFPSRTLQGEEEVEGHERDQIRQWLKS